LMYRMELVSLMSCSLGPEVGSSDCFDDFKRVCVMI
jgi:hypothetical protein